MAFAACSSDGTRSYGGSGGSSTGGSAPAAAGNPATPSGGSTVTPGTGGSNPGSAGSVTTGTAGSDASGGGTTSAGGTGSTTGGTPGSSAGSSAGGAPATNGITVKLDATHQTIQGFGINTALMPSGKTFPVDKLFTTTATDSIGLSILRIGMNTDGSLTGQFISESKAKNPDLKVIGSCWSAPAKCKSNNNVKQGGYLLDTGTCMDDWATAIANFAKAQNLYAMSIANESDFASCASKGPPCTDDYETMTYTAKQMVKWVKIAGPKIKSISPNTKVIAPEASEWIHAWSNASGTGSTVSSHPQSSDPLACGCFSTTLDATGCAQTCLDGNGYDYGHWLWKDQDAWKAFDIFGVHEYDSQKAFAWPADVNNGKRDKEVWQTEMSGVKYWPEEGPSTDINNGVVVAGWIHSALTVGEASAWLWWWYESYYQNDNEGLAVVQGSSTIAKRYFTLGNYSKFIRPGYTAVEVVGNSNADVLLSGFKGSDGTVVIVAVNKGGSNVTLPIAISGGTAPAMLTPNVTSATDNLKAGTPVAVTGGSFMAALPSKTVTTFVGK
ncbi:MAG TPA: glycoside hydrolase family 30 beta sandwich domain-containing protein [Polyangiaceae bacterium]|nr:glycoside hydrolase family 30 beta sandwich domain-containing protein [Polyangiaceae bacterium]